MNARHYEPEALAARIESASRVRIAREKKLSDARALIREAGIQTPWELMAMLCNLHASVKTATTLVHEYKDRLIELTTDLDAELKEPEPEISVLPSHPRKGPSYSRSN